MPEPLLLLLKTGRLGPLTLGMSLGQVKEALTDIEDKLLRRTNKRKIFDYGDLTLHFVRDRLTIIRLSCTDGRVALPPQVDVNGLLEIKPVYINDFSRFLSQEGIEFEPRPWTEDLFALVLESGAQVYFDSGKLHSILLTSE